MKKLTIENKKLQLNKTKIADLSPAELGKVKGGVEQDQQFLSLISCHTDHNGSACSGCDTCCPSNGGGCGSSLC